jgi:hypothetical protein
MSLALKKEQRWKGDEIYILPLIICTLSQMLLGWPGQMKISPQKVQNLTRTDNFGYK